MPEMNPWTSLDVDPSSAGKVVELPNLVTGRLADVIASASAIGSPRELDWEQGARSLFRSEAAHWHRSRRFRWRSPAVAVMATSASLLIATSGLAAATGFPGPEARVVDQVLKSVDLTSQAPFATVSTAPSGASLVPAPPGVQPATLAAGPRPYAMHRSTCMGQGPGRFGAIATQVAGPSSSPACGDRQSAAGRSGSSVRAGAGQKPGGKQGSATVVTVGTAGFNQSPQRGAGTGAGTKRGGGVGTGTGAGMGAGTVTGPGTNRGGNQGAGTGTVTGTGTGTGTGTVTGTGPGTNRGGNQGTGTGTVTGTGPGTNRGGNQGTGTGRGKGPGPGANRGGNRGTGSGRGKGPGPGANRGGNRGTGSGGGGGVGNRHPGTTKRTRGESAQPSTGALGSVGPPTRYRLNARSSLRVRR